MESVFLDIRTRSSFANASLVTRENAAKQVITKPTNADVFSPVFACLALQRILFEQKQTGNTSTSTVVSYTESPAGKLETYRGSQLRDPSLQKRRCIPPKDGEQVNVAY